MEFSEILKKTLKKYSIKNYFVFDMSKAELIQYKKKLNFSKDLVIMKKI